jgi:hypothetical protein
MAKFIAIMLSTTNNVFLSTPVWSIFCNKKHHNTNLVFEGASYLGIIFANNKATFSTFSQCCKERQSLHAINLKKKRTCCYS